jgi:hypothetical protein
VVAVNDRKRRTMTAAHGDADAPCGTPSSHAVHDPFSMTLP